jgi:hypothetical protein
MGADRVERQPAIVAWIGVRHAGANRLRDGIRKRAGPRRGSTAVAQ